jgi:hypothetical protein
MTARYVLPIRTWRGLARTAADIDRRLSRLEGRQAAFVLMATIITATNLAVLTLALRAHLAG